MKLISMFVFLCLGIYLAFEYPDVARQILDRAMQLLNSIIATVKQYMG